MPLQRLHQLPQLLHSDGHRTPCLCFPFHSCPAREIPRIRQRVERQATDRQLHGQDRLCRRDSVTDVSLPLLRHPRLQLQLTADRTPHRQCLRPRTQKEAAGGAIAHRVHPAKLSRECQQRSSGWSRDTTRIVASLRR